MRVTIDLDRDLVIIPDNYFNKISQENDKLKKFGAQPQGAIDRIKRSFAVAMADTDNRLLTTTNARTSTIGKLPIDAPIKKVESTIDREAAAAAEK